MRRVLVVLGVLAAVLAGPAASAQEGGIGIRLTEGPTERRDDPRASVSIVDHVSPGEVLSRRVEVSNSTSAPVEVRTYVGSASITDGELVGDDGTGTGDLVDWSSVTPASLRVPAGGTAEATVRIAVPEDASPGERYGVIWAEAPTATVGGVTQVNRIGVRVYLSVGEGGEPASDFAVETLQAAREPDGRPAVLAQVRNTGGRALDMRGSLRLTEGPGGLAAGPFPAMLGTTLAPGDTAPVRVVLDKAVPAGPWLARLELSSGRVERAAQAQITFPEEPGVRAQVVTAAPLALREDPTILVPVAAGLLSLAALLLLLSLLRRRTLIRRRAAE